MGSLGNYGREIFCDTTREPLYRFVYSAEAGGYLQSGLVAQAEGGTRLLRGLFEQASLEEWFGERDAKPLFSQGLGESTDPVFSRRETMEGGDLDGSVIYGRQCECVLENEFVFCPVGAEICAVHRNSFGYEIECQGKIQDKFARFMLPFVLFTFVFLGCMLWASPKGRFALAYCRKIIHRWSDERYDLELNRQLDTLEERAIARRERLLRLRAQNPDRVYLSTASSNSQLAFLHRGGRADLDATSTPQPTLNAVANQRVVLLKTRKYESPQRQAGQSQGSPDTKGEHQETDLADGNEDFNGCEQCSICLQDFEPGERIGDLKCKHKFHKHCLRSWIQRKNYCPLCQGNLAQPRPRSRDDETSQQQPEQDEVQGMEMRNIPTPSVLSTQLD